MNEPTNIPSGSNETEPGKRTLLGMLAVFASFAVFVCLVSLGARALRTEPRPQPVPPSTASTAPHGEQLDPRIVAFLGPLATERRFDAWRITRIDPLQFGRMTLEIEGDAGERFVVDLHARSPESPPPIAETLKLALYLRTNQRGGQTPQTFITACTALARVLAAREAAGHEPPPLERLMPR
jgi:hypothetical protein